MSSISNFLTRSDFLTRFFFWILGYSLKEKYLILIQASATTTARFWEMNDLITGDRIDENSSAEARIFLNSETGKLIPQNISWPGRGKTREYVVTIYQGSDERRKVLISHHSSDKKVFEPTEEVMAAVASVRNQKLKSCAA